MFDRVKKQIADLLKISEESIQTDSRLVEDLKADSLDIVQMLIVLEEEFKIEFPDEEIATIKTVGDIAIFIEKHNK